MNGKNKLNFVEMWKLGKMNVVVVFYKIENEFIFVLNYEKVFKFFMENVIECFIVLE